MKAREKPTLLDPKARERLALLDPDYNYVIQKDYFFALPPLPFVVGVRLNRNFSCDNPLVSVKVQRLVISAPTSGLFSLYDLMLSNVCVLSGPIDAFEFSSGRHMKRATECLYCGAPRSYKRDECRYCTTQYPPKDEAGSLGKPVAGRIVTPANRVSVQISYSGWVWPGVVVGEKFELTVGLVGDAKFIL